MSNISVIVPYFNESKVIEYTFTNIIQQSHTPREIIFINSNSSDNSSDIINRLIQNYEGPIEIYNFDTNCRTPSEAKNYGIDKSKFEFIAFIDCDMSFPINWLESQINLFKKVYKPILLGQVVLEGNSIIDRCSVIHTYGYQRPRPCIPSSLVKKDFFIKKNYFENFNALYDQKWIKNNIKSSNAIINKDLFIHYLDINYAKSYKELSKKIIYYSLPTFKIYGLTNINILGLALSILIILLYPKFILFFIPLYFILRIMILPLLKSNFVNIFKHISYRLDILIITALIIDISKILGIVMGIFKTQISHYQR